MRTPNHPIAMLAAASLRSTTPRRTALGGSVMGMRLSVILTAWPAKEVRNLLSIFRLLSHDATPRVTVADTVDAEHCAEASAAKDASAGCYGRAEHVGVL